MYTPPQFINTTYKEWREVFMHSTVVCIRTSIRRTSITAFETSFLLCSPFALSDFRSVEAESVGWRTRQQLTCTVSLEWLEKFDSSSLLSSNDRVGANNSQKKTPLNVLTRSPGKKGCREKVAERKFIVCECRTVSLIYILTLNKYTYHNCLYWVR